MVRRYVREGVAGVLAVALGWWMHGGRAVEAAPAMTGSAFQFSNLNESSSLAMYNAEDGMVYVYQGVMTGNSHLNCSYRFKLAKIGAPIDRENCPAGSPFR